MVFEILFLIYRYLSVVYRVEGADVPLGYLELDSRARSSSDVHTGDNGSSRITGTKVTKYVSFFKSQLPTSSLIIPPYTKSSPLESSDRHFSKL